MGAVTLVDLYVRSVDSFLSKVGAIGPDQWTAPTPCTDWDVRTLVNHVVYEQLWSVPLFDGATIAEVGDRFEGDLLGEDARAAATAAAQETAAAVKSDGAIDRTVHLSFGDTPAAEYVHQLFADHLVHSWDLAVAVGTDATLDPEAARACLDWFRDREDSYRSAGIIGPRVDLPAGASDQDQLLAAFGRDPDWAPA
jgi:uncharacterized protein (TIGR03086 family)